MTPFDESSWNDIQRVEGWAGEVRVNLIRLLGIILFYGRHLAEVLISPADAPVRGVFHLRVTTIALIWAALAIFLHRCLRQRFYPTWLKYVTSVVDVLIVTVLCTLGAGPRSPLALLYFVSIATTPLRLSLRLVYTTTIAAMLGYLFLLGHYAWYIVGFHRYYSTPELRIPRGEEVIALLALLVSGALAAQIVRQCRRLVLQPGIAIAMGDRAQ